MKSILTVTVALFFTASFAGAVSRIGGGKIQSVSSGFEMNVNLLFSPADIQNDSVRCLGPISVIQRGANATMGTQYFEVSEFAREFPDATSANSQELITRFEKSGWKAQPSENCNTVLRLRTDGAVAYIVTWGSGKGFVMKGTPTAQTEQAMREALLSLKINGGCAWK